MGWIALTMVLLLQWNARILLANGQEFKKYVDDLSSKPDVICEKENWLRLNFRIFGYASVRCVGGGEGRGRMCNIY